MTNFLFNQEPKIGIITIVSDNNFHLLTESLLSILAETNEYSYVIIIVDCVTNKLGNNVSSFAIANPEKVFYLQYSPKELNAAKKIGIDFCINTWLSMEIIYFLNLQQKSLEKIIETTPNTLFNFSSQNSELSWFSNSVSNLSFSKESLNDSVNNQLKLALAYYQKAKLDLQQGLQIYHLTLNNINSEEKINHEEFLLIQSFLEKSEKTIKNSINQIDFLFTTYNSSNLENKLANTQQIELQQNADTLVLFYPDYRKTNPYQASLYSYASENDYINSGTIDEAIELSKIYRASKKVIFHLHWTSFILAPAKTQEEAELLKQKFIEKLYLFLSLDGIFVWTIHNTLPHDSRYPNLEIKLRSKLTEIASRIHIHSQKSIPEVEEFFSIPKDKLEVIHHGNYVGTYPNYITREQARKRFELSPDKIVFLFLGQIRPYKGIEDLITAFVEVSKKIPHSYLLIAGNPVHPFRKKEIENKAKIFSNVKVIEKAIPDGELQWFFNAADVVVSPYRNILTSGSVINALSFSRPVIAPNVGMIQELIQDGYNGFTYELGSIKSLTQAMFNMIEVITKIEDKEKLYQQCFQSVEKLTWHQHSQLLFKNLQKLGFTKYEYITIETETVACQVWTPFNNPIKLDNNSPKVAIIILNYNCTDDILTLIKSLEQSSYQNFQVIIIDNDSPSSSFQNLLSLFSKYLIIRSPNNLGYAGGNNLGIQYLKNHDFDFTWILNPDTIIQKNTLEELVLAAKKYPEISIYGSVICWTQRPEIVWFGGGKVNITEKQFHTYHLYDGQDRNLIPKENYYEVDYVTGASIFCSATLFTEIGLIPEKYFLYFEETDWCLTAKNKGHKIAVIPKSELYHSKKSQAGKLPTKYYFYYYIRSSVLFMVKYFSQDKKLIKQSIEDKFIKPWLDKITQHSSKQALYFQALAEKALEHGFSGITGKVNLLNVFQNEDNLSDFIANPVEGNLEIVNRKEISGWAWNKNQPLETLEVTIKIDEQIYQNIFANQYVEHLEKNRKGDGCYGFKLTPPTILFDSQTHTVEAWVDNIKLPSNIAELIQFEELPPKYQGRIDGIFNKQLKGWALDENNPNKILTVEILDGKEVIFVTECNLERPDLIKAGFPTLTAGFQVNIPSVYFDDQNHQLGLKVLGSEEILFTRKLKINKSDYPLLAVNSLQEMFCWLYHYREISMIHPENRDSIYLKQIEAWGDELAYKFKNREQNHLVSIIMPTFNRSKTIKTAIESVQGQSYTNWELIIVDDDSYDDTVSLVKEIIKDEKISTIKLIELKENGGVSKARNAGLAIAKGEIIAYLDSDNMWDSDFLLVMVNMLLDNPWAKSAYCGDRIWQHYHDTTNSEQTSEITSIRLGHFNKSLIENRNYIDLNVFVHWYEIYETLGGFREDMRRLVDWELIVRYTHFSPPKFIPAILVNYHMGLCDNQITKVESYDLNLLKMGETIEQLHKISIIEKNTITSPTFTEIIINGYDADFNSLELCLQALIANTDFEKVKIVVYLSDNKSVLNKEVFSLLAQQDKIEFRNFESNKSSDIMNHAVQYLSTNAGLIFLNYQAIVGANWLESLLTPAETRDDIAIVIPRDIRNKNDDWANKIIPYANKFSDIDVMLNPENNMIINPGFDENKYLVELSNFKFFCVYFTNKLLSQINLSVLTNWDDENWSQFIASVVNDIDKKGKIVYTPKSIVYHNSYFN